MEKEVKEVTMEELICLLQSQRGEFIIHIEPGEEDTDEGCGYTKSFPA